MQVHLLYEDKDAVSEVDLSEADKAAGNDLSLDKLLEAMSGGDAFLAEAIKPRLYTDRLNIEEILYRQEMLQACLSQPEGLRQLYSLAVQGAANEAADNYMLFTHTASLRLLGAVRELEGMLPLFSRMCILSGKLQHIMRARGWQSFFSRLERDFTIAYIQKVQAFLQELSFPNGIWLSACLGEQRLSPSDYRACYAEGEGFQPDWLDRLCEQLKPQKKHLINIPACDESGQRVLREIKDEALLEAADLVTACKDNLHSFFLTMKKELAFYLGGVLLYERLQKKSIPVCFPVPEAEKQNFSCRNLYAVSLALQEENATVANTVEAGQQALVMITGANHGGKTTFLRGLGQAVRMMGCGLFVAAESFCAGTGKVFTHFTRSEDRLLQSGKLSEELQRLNILMSCMQKGDMLLLNESFSSTNEYEGSQIAVEILQGLLLAGIRVVFVTHFYYLAAYFYNQAREDFLFLRAEKDRSGRNVFRLGVGEPLPTAYGQEIYRQVFGENE